MILSVEKYEHSQTRASDRKILVFFFTKICLKTNEKNCEIFKGNKKNVLEMGGNILDFLKCFFQVGKAEIFTEKYKKIAITTAEEVQIFLHFFYNFQYMQEEMIIFGCE